jgi:hypothetical protein
MGDGGMRAAIVIFNDYIDEQCQARQGTPEPSLTLFS